MIIYFILMTSMCDSVVILKGEIRCWSLLGVRGLRSHIKKMKTGISLLVYNIKTTSTSFAIISV